MVAADTTCCARIPTCCCELPVLQDLVAAAKEAEAAEKSAAGAEGSAGGLLSDTCCAACCHGCGSRSSGLSFACLLVWNHCWPSHRPYAGGAGGSGSGKRAAKRQRVYEEHRPMSEITAGIKAGRYHQGTLR